MRIGICDDNITDLNAMEKLFQRSAPEYRIDTYSDSITLLSAIKAGAEYDLLFLDIIMPMLSGMELAREISKIAPEIPIVFLTDSDAYAVEAFAVKALHYILKPMTESALKECLLRLNEKQRTRRRIYILSSSGTQHLFFANEIQYVESDAHYCILFLTDGTSIKFRMTQSEILGSLGDSFIQVSRGLIVNADFILQFGSKSCILKNGREVLFSRKNLDAIHTAYAEYVFSQLSQNKSNR